MAASDAMFIASALLITPLARAAATPQQPAAETRIKIRVVVPERPIVAFPVQVTPRRISIDVDGKTLEMEDLPRVAVAGEGEAVNPQPNIFFRRAMAFTSGNFDQLVFGGRDLRSRRAALHDTMAEWIKGVELRRRLEPAERRRLELAGTGDIERFLRRVEAARQEFEVNRFDYERGRALIPSLTTLGHEFDAGPFGPGSLFQKTSVGLMMDGLADPLRFGRPAGGQTPPQARR